MNAATRTRARRWLRGLAIILVGLTLVGAASAAFTWYSLFGGTGEPIDSHAIEFTDETQDEDWERCEILFARMDRTLKRIKDLEGTMRKQELIDGRLEEPAEIYIKARRNPKSIYLRWIEPNEGREVIFQVRRRRNRLIAHEGGPLRHVSPDVLMELDNPFAMKFSRHPVDELSVQYLIAQLPRYLADAEAYPDREIAINEELQLGERDCIHIRLKYPPETDGPTEYRRFDVYLDRYEFMPIRWERYGESVDGVDQLLEYFELVEFERNVGLTDEDFDPENDAYQFRPDWQFEL